MQTVALGVLVFARTDRPGWTGLVAAAAFLPIGLLAPIGGVLADRLDRRRWLILTTLAEMAFAAVLAVLAATGEDPPGVLVALAFLGGAAGAIGFPAYQAMVPDLVPREHLLGAVSLSSAQFNLGRVIGPALAGVALLTHDYGLVFGINAASFGAVVVALVMVRLPRPVVVTGPWSLGARVTDGLHVAMAEPGCRAAIGLIAVVALLASPFIALVPAMAGVIHHGGIDTGEATALLVTAQGVGAVGGALALPSLADRFGRPLMVRLALTALPVVLIAYGLAPSLAWSVLAFVGVGAVYITVLSGLNTVVQLRAPAAARGRVLGIYMMGLGIIYPIGAVLQGWIADHVGVRAITVAGALVLLGSVAVVTLARPGLFGSMGDPAAPAGPDDPAQPSDPGDPVGPVGGGRSGDAPIRPVIEPIR